VNIRFDFLPSQIIPPTTMPVHMSGFSADISWHSRNSGQ
jgi:hypothetical protein